MIAAICILFCVIRSDAPPPPKVDYLCETLKQEMQILLKPLKCTSCSDEQAAALSSVRKKYHKRCKSKS